MVESVQFDQIKEAVIPEGTWKYIQIQVQCKQSGQERLFVRGYSDLEYHSEIFQTFGDTELGGLKNFKQSCPGGGRIKYDLSQKNISIYGYSQSYGLADHSKTKEILERNYPEHTITWSNEGY